MNRKRRLKRKLDILLGGKEHNPKKEEATRYIGSEKRGPKIRGPKGKCPYCEASFSTGKQRAYHIKLVHRRGHEQTIGDQETRTDG